MLWTFTNNSAAPDLRKARTCYLVVKLYGTLLAKGSEGSLFYGLCNCGFKGKKHKTLIK